MNVLAGGWTAKRIPLLSFVLVVPTQKHKIQPMVQRKVKQ
jgi:hypothetical protein